MARSSEPSPDALTEYIGANVSKHDVEIIERIMRAMGVSKAAAIRMLLRAGAQSSRWNQFTREGE